MSELNQLLLGLDYKTNFNEHDFYLSKSNSNAFLINGNNIDNSIFKYLKLYESIRIDDFEECKEEEILYSIFNLIDQDNKYMLINSLKPINQIEFDLSDLASRSKNCLYAEIENPDDELLFAIIFKNFSDRQIKIEKKIIDFIISRIDRSYRKIDEFIYKIDELSLKKKNQLI